MNYNSPAFEPYKISINLIVSIIILVAFIPILFFMRSLITEENYFLVLATLLTLLNVGACFLALGLVQDFKRHESQVNKYNNAVKSAVKDLYGITILESVWRNRCRVERMMATSVSGTHIIVDLKVVNNGADLLIFDGSRELSRI